jgi:tetratricopeptide (TPR) repeat protein
MYIKVAQNVGPGNNRGLRQILVCAGDGWTNCFEWAYDMRLLATCFFFSLSVLMAEDSGPTTDWRVWLNRGLQAFKNGQYSEAAVNFRKVVDLYPTLPGPRLYLATSYMQQYIPGVESAENTAMAQKAKTEFRGVLRLNAKDLVALASLGLLALNQRKFDDATTWYQKLIDGDPNNSVAYYSMGVVAWAKWSPAWAKARREVGMRPEDRGPIPSPVVRRKMRAQYSAVIDEGITNLNRALHLNPVYADAMAYMHLLVREKADLRDTTKDYDSDIREADQWLLKTFEARRSRKEQPQQGVALPAPPLPPPPPPPRARR